MLADSGIPAFILTEFGLSPTVPVHPIGSGHINKTFKIEGEPSFILQRLNTTIFKNPQGIASNIRRAANYLRKNHPSYLFISPVLSLSKQEMVEDNDGYLWRMYPYISDSFTLDQLETEDQARSAAIEFGKFNRLMSQEDARAYQDILPGFHDLPKRYAQFQDALAQASPQRKEAASSCINDALTNSFLTDQYSQLVEKGILTPRIMHNDTKINNILFDKITREALAVIDLDTVMPGYFIYDLGDMVRTFVSPVSEEEKDTSKIIFRKEFYDAIITGYMSQMEQVLSPEEKKLIPFAGKMMTYIMALRMLTDYLNGDIYYHTTYPGQNLVRATNQFYLLKLIHQNT